MIYRTFLLLVSVAVFVACKPEEQQTVSGTIANAEGKTVTLIGYEGKQQDTVGTQTLGAEGKFNIPVNAGELNFYTLAVQDGGALVLAFDSTESPKIEADFENINRKYKVSGSEESQRVRNLFVNSMGYQVKMDSMMKLMKQPRGGGMKLNERRQLQSTYNDVRTEYKNFLTDFIDEDTTSIANFSILQKLDPKQDYEYFIKVRNGLKPTMQGNPFYDELANNVAKLEEQQKMAEAIAPGQPAPEIELPNPEGDLVSLSSLKGEYVLIDFWASWCKPCRRENPNVVKLYNKYSEENFEIYGVSLDRSKAKWEQAIAQDGLEWIHVSDLKFWQSAAAQLYNVRSIPYTVLLNPDGEIMETKLRGGKLENKLESIFGY